MRAALFDLDQTLLPYDTQALFCNFVLRREGWRRLYPLVFGPALPLKALHLIDTRVLKRMFLSYLWKLPASRVMSMADEFAESVVPPLLYPAIVAEVERHREEGRTLILTSASPDIYVGPIARQLGFDHWFGTPVVLKEGGMPLVPQIAGANNKGVAKLHRMKELFGSGQSLPLPGCYAYSDSKADLPMLRWVEYAVTVNPDPLLEGIATDEGWPILRPPRPQASRMAFGWDCAMQSLGLWRARP